jgi:hypothetical protein
VFGIDEFGIIKENGALLDTRSNKCVFGNHDEAGGNHIGGDKSHYDRSHGGAKRQGHALVQVESDETHHYGANGLVQVESDDALHYPPLDNKLGTLNAFRARCSSLVIYNQQLGNAF